MRGGLGHHIVHVVGEQVALLHEVLGGLGDAVQIHLATCVALGNREPAIAGALAGITVIAAIIGFVLGPKK